MLKRLLISIIFTLISSHALASNPSSLGVLELAFSDGRPAVNGIQNVNNALKGIGVKVTEASIPNNVQDVLERSKKQALSKQDQSLLLETFALHRGELLQQIEIAGREPAVPRGGLLSTSEPNVSPYPKVYDMKSMSEETKYFLQHKFGKLHVNSSDSGEGIDEVMTIISGGQWTWFFVLEDGVVGKLTLGYVDRESSAWRISYPGLVPHGGFFDADYGLVVAHAHGPENFIMRYEDPSVNWSDSLGANPWIDFSKEIPVLLKETASF
ncbi:hypothetical protein [Vibrio sp. HN007]|uniref:hypothetical protein n=1 Tax=Vibrio iocasae TaxID=3098914 RepID=UPI0035D4E47E